jgi:hypothetical protein
MGSLRAERQAWQAMRQSAPAVVSTEVATVGDWQWVGFGWSTRGDAWLAGVEQRAMAQARTDARDALCIEKAMGIEKARGGDDHFSVTSSDDWERDDRRVGT